MDKKNPQNFPQGNKKNMKTSSRHNRVNLPTTKIDVVHETVSFETGCLAV